MSRTLGLILVAALAPCPAWGLSGHVTTGAQVRDEDASGEGQVLEPAAPMEPIPADAPPSPPLEQPPAKTSDDELSDEENWLDASHALIERRIFAPVLRIDRFFSDERDLDADRSRSFVRWRNELRLDEEGSTARFSTGISANFRLPGLRKQLRRLRVEIAGQTRDALGALFPEDDEAGDESPAERLGSADAGLRFRLWETISAHADIGAGVLVRLPPGGYGRLRLRFVQPLGRRVLSRQAITGFWRTDTRFGTTASAEVERPFGRTTLVRVVGSSTLTEVSRGIEWSVDAAYLVAFYDRTGAQIGASVNGATDALPGDPGLDRYRIYTRLRRDFYRHWIFFELEPEYAWPWSAERGRHATWGVALRLEVQFQGNEPPIIP